ncbi:MAG: response regulator transcription factor, partial [Syntrophobacteria bacterium]
MKYGSVILADRHQNMLEGIRGLLEAMFETVVMVADKASLFDTAEKINPDLAVVDLSLPVSGEINIARQLKDKYPELKIIILSVHDEQTVVSEIMASGVSGFVLKRSVASDLILAVDKVLG